ncbi:MAG: family metallopeptidase [Rickettsiaceae bacterium]|jgi:murein DD-endopeptidase MepM/ murein hydrolase activator NlpD|nr:family metallopeptidase [Rickettsiaceae bacterium]
MQKLIGFLLLSILVFSCSQKKAPVVNRGSVVYNKNSYKSKNKNAVADKNVAAENGPVTVAANDTVYSIARKYNVALRDLISENNLTPPYILKVGDKIKLPSSKYYQVATGDTLYSISRKYGMNVNNLVTINNLKEPYSVWVGQMLKVSNNAPADSPASVAYKKAEPVKVLTQDLSSPAPIKIEKPKADLEVANKNNRFIWPIKGQVISKFGPKPGGLYNDGINIKAKSGDGVKSVEDGVVAYAGNELRGYGNLIIVKHSGGWISAYGHLDKTKVTRGAKVKKGQSIATVGSTGNVKSPQLYFGLRKGREAVNPQIYL